MHVSTRGTVCEVVGSQQHLFQMQKRRHTVRPDSIVLEEVHGCSWCGRVTDPAVAATKSLSTVIHSNPVHW
jgi:hypothetical protein